MSETIPRTQMIPRILRGIALTGALCAGLIIAATVVLWSADLYEARNKWEHAKLALFSDWQPDLWCPEGRVSETCEEIDAFEAALEAASDFTFFRSEPIEGTGLLVQIGVRFATARDVVDGIPARKWCYISIPQGGGIHQIELATQSADDPPVYPHLTGLDEEALAWAGLGVNALTLIARSHCRFET